MIGIPLGIMTRSSNMLISLGISFVLILFVYYPLVATGLVLADSMNFPIIPSVWAANVVNIILGVSCLEKYLLNNACNAARLSPYYGNGAESHVYVILNKCMVMLL
jgi:hypothetical protein